MQDAPTPAEIVRLVAAFLRDVAVPQLTGAAAFNARVAANALDLVGRELSIDPKSHDEEAARLRKLLGNDGSVPDLTRELSSAIAAGQLGFGTSELAEHLWSTTMEKLTVDQPTYASFRAELEVNRDKQGDS
jgi:hypothetical protein